MQTTRRKHIHGRMGGKFLNKGQYIFVNSILKCFDLHHVQDYTVMLAKQLGVKQVTMKQPNLGRALSPNELNFFRDEQVSQLYELMLEAKKPRDSPHEEEEPSSR